MKDTYTFPDDFYYDETDIDMFDDGLLPCPFCGKKPNGIIIGTEFVNDVEIKIYCVDHACAVIQSTEYTYSYEDTINNWNRRANE